MTSSVTESFENYPAFWRLYLKQHANPWTRYLHIAGILIAVAILITAVLSANPWLLFGAVVAGYGPAWIAHLLIEKNQPLTWRYPVWSFISDMRMTATWLTGNLKSEMQAAGVRQDRPD